MSESVPELTFDEEATDFVLSMFDKEVDEEGYIVESETGDRVLTPEGTEIRAEDLGVIAKGSQEFVEDNFVSLLNYVDRQRA